MDQGRANFNCAVTKCVNDEESKTKCNSGNHFVLVEGRKGTGSNLDSYSDDMENRNASRKKVCLPFFRLFIGKMRAALVPLPISDA